MLCIICKEDVHNICDHYKNEHCVFFCDDCEIIAKSEIAFKLHFLNCRPAPFTIPSMDTGILLENMDKHINATKAICFCGSTVDRRRLIELIYEFIVPNSKMH